MREPHAQVVPALGEVFVGDPSSEFVMEVGSEGSSKEFDLQMVYKEGEEVNTFSRFGWMGLKM